MSELIQDLSGRLFNAGYRTKQTQDRLMVFDTDDESDYLLVRIEQSSLDTELNKVIILVHKQGAVTHMLIANVLSPWNIRDFVLDMMTASRLRKVGGLCSGNG